MVVGIYHSNQLTVYPQCMNAIKRDAYLPNRPLLEVVLAVVGSVATCRRPSCGRRCFAAAKLVKADPFSTKKAERVRTEASRLEDEVNFMVLSLELRYLCKGEKCKMYGILSSFFVACRFLLFLCWCGGARSLFCLWWEIFLL